MTTRQTIGNVLRRSVSTPARESAVLWVAVLLCSFVKMRAYWQHGRFWAEEGRDFFVDIAARDGGHGLLYVFNGHLEFMTNLVVLCSTLVDPQRAPLVTTWFSWLLQLLPIGLLIHGRRQVGLSFGRALLFVLAAAAIPQSPEVWANSINLHFHFALLAGLIAVLPSPSGAQARLFRVLLLGAGLSGIPANSLLPVFVARAVRARLRERWIQVGILAATSALQLGLLVQHGLTAEGRDVVTDPLVLWLALLAQHVVSPLLGIKLAGHAILRFNLLVNDSPASWALALAVSAAYVSLWVLVVKRRWTTSAWCLGVALLLAVFCVLTSLGNRVVLVSAETGGRYFYASNLLLLLGVLLAIPKVTAPAPRRTWRAVFVLWALLSWHGLRNYIDGPAWPEAWRQARSAGAGQIAIWPRGWTMANPGAGDPEPRN